MINLNVNKQFRVGQLYLACFITKKVEGSKKIKNNPEINAAASRFSV